MIWEGVGSENHTWSDQCLGSDDVNFSLKLGFHGNILIAVSMSPVTQASGCHPNLQESMSSQQTSKHSMYAVDRERCCSYLACVTD